MSKYLKERVKKKSPYKQAKGRVKISLLYSSPDGVIEIDQDLGAWTEEESARKGFNLLKRMLHEDLDIVARDILKGTPWTR